LERACDIEDKLKDDIRLHERKKSGAANGNDIVIQAEMDIWKTKLKTVRRGISRYETARATAYAMELNGYRARADEPRKLEDVRDR
jgi:hypothetical protein